MPQRMIVPWLLLLVCTSTSAAQQSQDRRGGFGPGRRGFGEGVVGLVRLREVQQELELNDAQRELLDALHDDLRTQVRVAFRRGNEPQPREGSDSQGREQQRRNRIREINRQGEELVMLVLEPEQAKRLGELRLQREGTRSFDRPEIAKALGLTEAQLTQIREIRDSARQDTRDPSPPQRRAQRRRMESDVLAVLSGAQRQRWEEMQGDEFQFRAMRNNRFGRRPSGADERPREREGP